MLTVRTLVVTPFQQNCRILFNQDGGSRDALLIDPGGDAGVILSALEREQLTLKEVWLTHSHLDHCGGAREILEAYPGVALIGHPDEKVMRSKVKEIATMYGLSDAGLENAPEPTVYLRGGEEREILGVTFQVLFTPGHSPGHLSFYSESENLLLGGDVLFSGSIGRTDLPGGDHKLLVKMIKTKLFNLPDSTRVLCGHGPDTTIGEEKRSNPFVGEGTDSGSD